MIYLSNKTIHVDCGNCLSYKNVSADRIDNSLGHIDGNTTITCIHCNVSRKKMSIDRFRELKRIEKNSDKVIFQIDEEYKDIYHMMKRILSEDRQSFSQDMQKQMNQQFEEINLLRKSLDMMLMLCIFGVSGIKCHVED